MAAHTGGTARDATPDSGTKVAVVGSKSSSLVLIRPLESISKELIFQQRMNRPFKVVQNLPIQKNRTSMPDYSTLKHPLSVKDSGVLYNSLIVSRFNWSYHIFNTYWTRKEQMLMGSDSKKKDRMVRFCDSKIFCGVHTFDIKLFFLKDDEREKAFRDEQERRKEEKLLKRKQKQEEAQRKKEEKERLEKEKEALRNKTKEDILRQQSLFVQQQQKDGMAIISDIKTNLDVAQKSDVVDTANTKLPLPSGIPAAAKDVAAQSLPSKIGSNESTITLGTSNDGKQEGKEENAQAVSTEQQQQQQQQQQPALSEKESAKHTEENSTKNESPNATGIEQSSNGPRRAGEFSKDLMGNPESAVMIQNLNYMGKRDPYLNNLMKIVASGTSSTEQLVEFQKYIHKAKNMGDVTGYMQKLKLKQKYTPKEKDKETATSEKEVKKDKVVKPKTEKPKVLLSPEEARKQNELNRLNQERAREEKQRLREERERMKILEKQERIDRKRRERIERETFKQRQREEKELAREQKKQERLAEKEKARLEKEEKAKEKQLQKEKERELRRVKRLDSDDEDMDESFDDRMAKLNNTETNEDIWNDKLTPLQERYSTGASLVFEFLENNSARFVIPKDSIFELIENEQENDNPDTNDADKATEGSNEESKDPTLEKPNDSPTNELSPKKQDSESDLVKEEKTEESSRPSSPYVTILASFLLVHNQKEIDGWDRRREEERKAKEEEERLRLENIKKEKEAEQTNTIAENARKRRRKKTSWGTNKRSTRASKNAKEMEQLRREEEDYHEEDEDLRKQENGTTEKVRPTPVYSSVTITLSKIPFRFANFVLNSGNGPEVSRSNMEEVMKTGKRVELDQLWYQLDGIKDELLAETLRYNLNRLDYSNCGAKKNKAAFLKKFGRGGRS